MKNLLFVLALVAVSTSCFAKGGSSLPEVKTVTSVDLNRYAGKWYQIAFFPTRFQKNCTVNTTATYGLLSDGRVSVLNECYKNKNNKYQSISGTARVVPGSNNSKLLVKFFWFAPAGDYWIIDLDPNYELAMVGSPDREFLWILSRSPQITSEKYEALKLKARAQFFDDSRLQLTTELMK